ncbi:MAG: hypothetical protein HY673_07050 [Chloroflexi bacterium]|nr:hypothetical protein [Chloroflexota bacterium]
MNLQDRKWTDEEFLAKRRKVLALWPTGSQIDLGEAIDYVKHIPDHRNWNQKIARARTEGRILIEGLVGHPTIEETVEHMRFVEEAGADLHTVIADTYSRRNMFDRAKQALERGIKEGRTLLNGVPLVVYGLKESRRLAQSSALPVLYVTGMVEEPMLLAEMAAASGFQISSGGLDSVMKASKNYPADKRLENARYNGRLAAYYTERGAPVHVKAAAHLSGWEPHGMRIAVSILQALLMAEQGVRHMSIPLAQVLSLVQDVAGMNVVRQLLPEYLERGGCWDTDLYVCSYPYQGEWSRDVDRAAAISAWAAVIGILGGPDWIIVKSVEEGQAAPTKEGSAAAIKIARQLLLALGRQRLPRSRELQLEEEMLELEVRAIVDRVIEMGEGDIAAGQVRAVKEGIIDLPFQPWVHLAGKVLTVRDGDGAVRYLEHGNVPLPAEVVDYHREKVAGREKAEGRKADLDMVIEDVNFLAKANPSPPLKKGD